MFCLFAPANLIKSSEAVGVILGNGLIGSEKKSLNVVIGFELFWLTELELLKMKQT